MTARYAVRKHLLQRKSVASMATYFNEWLDVEYYVQSVDSDAVPIYHTSTTTIWWCPNTNFILSATTMEVKCV